MQKQFDDLPSVSVDEAKKGVVDVRPLRKSLETPISSASVTAPP